MEDEGREKEEEAGRGEGKANLSAPPQKSTLKGVGGEGRGEGGEVGEFLEKGGG